MNQREAIKAFWTWWPTVAEAFAKSFKSGPSQSLIDAMVAHVAAIDPGLDWEFGPGVKSTHHLCLASKGDPALRVVTERWLRGALPDETWEFYPARQGSEVGASMSLRIAEFDLKLDEMRFAVEHDDNRELVNLIVDHPGFADIDDDSLKTRIAFIALDNTLGEDDVERWVGSVVVAEGALDQSIPLTALRAHVDQFAAKATGDRWALLSGSFDGAPVFVSTNTAIKRIDHLLLDTHVTLSITLANPTEEGLPTDEEAAALDAMEDALIAQLGKEAVFIGRETSRGQRELHLHVMEGGPAAAIIARWRAQHPGVHIESSVESDPQWEILRRWG